MGVMERLVRVSKQVVPQKILRCRTAESLSSAKLNAVLAERVASPRVGGLQEVVLLGPHHPNGRVARRVHQGGGAEDVEAKGPFKAPKATQIRLINQVSATRPGIGLVNNLHPLEHE